MGERERMLAALGDDKLAIKVLDCLECMYKPASIQRKVGISARQYREIMSRIEAASETISHA